METVQASMAAWSNNHLLQMQVFCGTHNVHDSESMGKQGIMRQSKSCKPALHFQGAGDIDEINPVSMTLNWASTTVATCALEKSEILDTT